VLITITNAFQSWNQQNWKIRHCVAVAHHEKIEIRLSSRQVEGITLTIMCREAFCVADLICLQQNRATMYELFERDTLIAMGRGHVFILHRMRQEGIDP